MKKNKVLIDLSMFLYLVTGFFYFLLGNGYYWLIVSVIPISLYVINAVVSMDKENYGWVIFICFLWISAMVSVHTTLSYKYLMVIGISFLGKLIFESVYGWHMKFGKITMLFATIHVIAVVLSYYFPEFIKGIADKLYTGEVLDAYTQLMEQEAYAGISGQTSYAAFFVSIYIGIIVCNILNGKFNLWNILKLLLGIFALLLTVKRSFIIANLIAVIFVLYVQNKGNAKFFRNILIFTVAGSLAYSIFSNYSFITNLMTKSTLLLETGDITNGRAYLWSETYKLWLEKPIFGHGINVLGEYYGLSTHNSYLQILAEAGVFGLVSMLFAVIFSLVKSCKIYKDIAKDTLLTDKEKAIFLSSIYVQIVFIIYCFSGNPMYGITFLLLSLLFISCIKSFLQRKA